MDGNLAMVLTAIALYTSNINTLERKQNIFRLYYYYLTAIALSTSNINTLEREQNIFRLYYPKAKLQSYILHSTKSAYKVKSHHSGANKDTHFDDLNWSVYTV